MGDPWKGRRPSGIGLLELVLARRPRMRGSVAWWKANVEILRRLIKSTEHLLG